MLELRLKAEDALGEQFRIKDFHHTVLALGPVPLFTLERVIKDWISELVTEQQIALEYLD